MPGAEKQRLKKMTVGLFDSKLSIVSGCPAEEKQWFKKMIDPKLSIVSECPDRKKWTRTKNVTKITKKNQKRKRTNQTRYHTPPV
jgi:hypothetical protein